MPPQIKLNRQLIAVATTNGTLQLEWEECSAKVRREQALLEEELVSRSDASFASFLLYLGFCDSKVNLSPSLNYWRDFASAFTAHLRVLPEIENLREEAEVLLDSNSLKELMGRVPPIVGSENIDKALLNFFWAKLNSAFQNEIRDFKGEVEEYLQTWSPDLHALGRIHFHLVENKKNEKFPFAFLATYAKGGGAKNRSKHLPLRHALDEYGEDSSKLLEMLVTVQRAALKSDLIQGLQDTGELFYPLTWTSEEAYQFLKEIPIYEDAGVLCRIPDWWKNKTSSVQLSFSVGEKPPSMLGLDAVLDFEAKLSLGGDTLSEGEVKKLLKESEGLAYLKGKWIELDRDKLKRTLLQLEKAKAMMKSEEVTLNEAMRILMGNQKESLGLGFDSGVDINCGKWMSEMLEKMRRPDLARTVKPGNNFHATLRPYQQDGLNWLWLMNSLRLGACLADDMGLGKTVQVLGLLQSVKNQRQKRASLILMPTTLLANWDAEIKRFAPKMKVYVAHAQAGTRKTMEALSDETLDKQDLVLSTYGLVKRHDWLREYPWHYVILDEAQAIKNPGSKQTRAVKEIKSVHRIAMTGTPVENRLSDLWSLFDFINPGLLGSAKEFTELSKKLKDHPEGYGQLRKLISPYILRRLKTDKSIISDLPDKIEMKSYSNLSKRQVALYGEIVSTIQDALENLSGMKRRGLILAALMKFKQICNHPDQYLGQKEYDEKDSGKFPRLREICETIREKRERVLVFTQFREMTEPLFDFLNEVFGRPGLVLHGGTPAKKRKELVEEFQGTEYVPYFILSIKAGGVGLNLTEANHVIHFDRWWNPAVENQATDRVFRIGQKKKVLVHKFISKGTIEEKIDAMIESKLGLAKNVIQTSSEKWVTEMDNKDLLNLFKLDVRSL